MTLSMTGFGRAAIAGKAGLYVVEARSVNSRYCDVRVQAPRDWLEIEHKVSNLVRERFSRGKFDLVLRIEPAPTKRGLHSEEEAVIRRYRRLKIIAKKLGMNEPPPLSAALAMLPGAGKGERDPEAHEVFLRATKAALEKMGQFRSREGAALVRDIKKRVRAIAKAVNKVAKTAEQTKKQRFERLGQRVAELLGGTRVDAGRLETEIALLAEKSDVTEEIVRLQSHFQRLDQLFASKEPVGRKLDFLIQEMNREINTIGSKSADLKTTGEVVMIKAELEKIREQAQNIE